MQFAAFIILTGVILIRPQELFIEVLGWPIYNVVILANLAISFMLMIPQISLTSIKSRPITALILGIFVAIIFSHAWHRNVYMMRICADDFFRVILFYLLLLGNVTTTVRLRSFLFWVTIFLAFLTILILLQFYGYIEMQTLKALTEGAYDEETGLKELYLRLQGTGLFNNPNAYSRILTVAVLLSFYWLTDSKTRFLAPLWIGFIFMFGHAQYLTRSRGGFLGLLAGLGMMFVSKIGVKKSIPVLAVAMPVVMVLFGGRQTDLSTDSGTGQLRIQMWDAGFELLKRTPLFGIGMNNYVEETHHVAHNSFVHAFVELGLFGGIMFVGVYYYAISQLWSLRKQQELIEDDQLVRLRPFLLAVFCGEVVGLMSISRCYILPTYMLLGIGAVYLNLVGQSPGVIVADFGRKTIVRLTQVGLLVLVALYAYTKYKLRLSG